MSPDAADGPAPDAAGRPELRTSLSLLQRARDRDRAAWDRLFYLYNPLVLNWCARAGVLPADAEDVAQEVFRELSRSLATFRDGQPGTTFRGWLRGITRNRVLMHFRKAGKAERGEGGSTAKMRLEGVIDPLGDDDQPEQISGLYHRALELVRGEFEERTWLMFWRAVIEERSSAEVAAEMSVTEAAVRQARSRVLRRLKEEVGEAID